MVPRLHLHLLLLPERGRAFHFRPRLARAIHFHLRLGWGVHFCLRLGWAILRLVVLLVKVNAGWAAGFPHPAMEKAFRPVAAGVSFAARSLPVFGRFAIVDPVSAAGFLLVAGSAAFARSVVAAAAVVVVVVLSVAVDSAATVFVAAAPDSAVAGPAYSVCSLAAGRAVAGLSCFLIRRSSV